MIGLRLDAFETNLDKEISSGSGGNSSGSDYSASEGGSVAGVGGERERTTASRCRLAFYGPVRESIFVCMYITIAIVAILSMIKSSFTSSHFFSFLSSNTSSNQQPSHYLIGTRNSTTTIILFRNRFGKNSYLPLETKRSCSI